MGSWLRNWALHGAAPEEVSQKLTGWLERKGFELRAAPPLAPGNEADEPVAFVLHRAPWSVVVYSGAFEEGERLRRELDRFPAWLELWIADSDAWGYTFFESHAATAAFASHASYADEADALGDDNGGAGRVCATLGLDERLDDVHRAERKRGVFADDAFRQFCGVLGIEPAYFSCEDLKSIVLNQPDGAVPDWSIRTLWFERARSLNARSHQPILHRRVLRELAPQPVAAPAEFTGNSLSGMPSAATVGALRGLFLIVGAGARVVGFLLGPLFRWGWARRRTHESDPVGAALSLPAAVQREGEWLVNARHQCRIRAPAPESPRDRAPVAPHGSVFGFVVAGQEVRCQALRASGLESHFNLSPTIALNADTSFTIGSLAARQLHKTWSTGQTAFELHDWFIEKPDVDGTLYHFSVMVRDGTLAPEQLDAITQVVKSFEFTA